MNPQQAMQESDISSDHPVPLASVLCTEELHRRPARLPDYERENRELVLLAQKLGNSPETILQALADSILELLDADSSGISQLTDDGQRFHWPAAAGVWRSHTGMGAPREFGPCGDVFDADAPLLFRHLEKRYTYFQSIDPPMVETLLVPVYVQRKAAGVIWVVAHNDRRKFDAQDLRQLVNLSTFASAAFQSVAYRDVLVKQEQVLRHRAAEVDDIQQRLREINGALMVGSVEQHQLRETADRLNDQLHKEIDQRTQAEEKLQLLNATLEQRVAERTLDAKRRTSQLQALAVQLTQAENRERRRLAQVLHDHLQQLLVGAKMRLSLLNLSTPQDSDRKTLAGVSSALDEAIEASRSLTVELSPPVLFNGGLGAGLPWLGRSMFEKHGLQVGVKVDPTALLDNQDLEAFLFQAVRELLFNIVKHAKVKQATVELRSIDEKFVELIVQDQGQGFDPKRSPNAVGRAGTGHSTMGFGLMSIQERLDVLGGKMSIESLEGMGTRISLTVPLHFVAKIGHPPTLIPTAAPVAVARRAKPDKPGKIRVLVVDDHKLVRQELVRLITNHADIEVVGEAANGKVALEQAALLHPDLVLMDVNMPIMGGIEATRLMTAQHPAVLVIGLSMHTEPEVAAEMRGAGAVDFLSKDGAPASLLAAIQRCGLGAGRPMGTKKKKVAKVSGKGETRKGKRKNG